MRVFLFAQNFFRSFFVLVSVIAVAGSIMGCAQNDEIDTRLNKGTTLTNSDVQTASTLVLYNQNGYTRLAINDGLSGNDSGGTTVALSSAVLTHNADIRIKKQMTPPTAQAVTTDPSVVSPSETAAAITSEIAAAATSAPTKSISFEWKEKDLKLFFTVDLGDRELKPVRIVSGEALVSVYFLPKSESELFVVFRTMQLFPPNKLNSRTLAVDTIAVAELNDDSFVIKRWLFGLTDVAREAKKFTKEKHLTPFLEKKMNEVGSVP